jgi:hypothetical protein
MAAPGTVIGWKLDRDDRAALLDRHPPRYESVIADHVTLEVGAAGKPVPPLVEAQIIGHADDSDGVEAMVVSIDGSSERPDGSVFHISWSLAPGRKARESNDLLKGRGWRTFDQAIPIRLLPARF